MRTQSSTYELTASDRVVGWLTEAVLTFILLSLIAVVRAMSGE